MTRLIISAYLFAALALVGCSDKTDPGGRSDVPDETPSGGKADAGKDAGRKDAGSQDGVDPNIGKGSDAGKSGGGIIVDPMAPGFTKDATKGSGLSDKDLGDLKTGGKTCSAPVLYPYDGTVFPAGLTAPTVMWAGTTVGSYIKLSYDKLESLDYQFAAGASDPGELRIPQEDWNEIVRRTRGTDMLVTVSTKIGGAISTCNYKWKIAQGAMTGALFFNTYNHPDKLGNGAVMRLVLGQPKDEIYLSYTGVPSLVGPCVSCHSVSANGQKLAASLHNYTPLTQSFLASSYEVGQELEPMPLAALPESTFGAFTPDGDYMLGMGNPECTAGANAFPRSPNNFPLVPGPSLATLHDTATGNPVEAKGLKPEWFMWMPQFSPKGDLVAFNHAKMGADGRTDRRELAIMSFDAATKTFSNLRVLVTNQGPAPSIDYNPLPTGSISMGGTTGNNCDTPVTSDVAAIPKGSCEGPCYPAWPFFTPDGEGIIYSLISEPDFTLAFPGRDTPSKSELWYVDLETKQKVRLDTAINSGGEEHKQASYYPTVLPVQVGGYYWLFFTSTRDWGHRDLSPTPLQVGANWFGGSSVLTATRKRIWVAAIKPRAFSEAGLEEFSDTSTPAFYLEGQTASGNVRAFATLNPCKDNGGECSSGLDCCTGFCNIAKGAEKGSCVPPKTCADVNEKCKVDTDCCPAGPGEQERLCIGDYCGFQIQ